MKASPARPGDGALFRTRVGKSTALLLLMALSACGTSGSSAGSRQTAASSAVPSSGAPSTSTPVRASSATVGPSTGPGSTPASSAITPGTRGPAGSGPAGSAATSSGAPTGLVIGRILTVRGLAAAGLTVASVEDDGGVALGGLFASEARLVTGAGGYTADLSSYPDAATARTSYQQLVASLGGTPTPLTGTGDRAAAVGMIVVVSKGAQVLEIEGRYSAAEQAKLDKLKATGGADLVPAVKSATEVVREQAERIARVAAEVVDGRPLPTGSTPLTYLPANALDPCSVPAESLDHDDITVTSAPAISDQPPALECRYTFAGSKGYGEPGTGVLAVYTLSAAQAQVAAPSTTVGAYVSAIARGATAGPAVYRTATLGGSRLVGTISGGFVDYAVALGSAPQKLRAGPPSAGSGEDPYDAEKLMLRVEDDQPKLIPGPDVCPKEVEPLTDDLLAEAEHRFALESGDIDDAPQLDEQFRGELGEWCRTVAGGP